MPLPDALQVLLRLILLLVWIVILCVVVCGSLSQPSGAGTRDEDNYLRVRMKLRAPRRVDCPERMIEERCQQDNTKVRLDEIDESAG